MRTELMRYDLNGNSIKWILSAILVLLASSVHGDPLKPEPSGVARVVVGSCLKQWQPAPALRSISALRPDVYLYLGDNVYADVGPYQQLAPDVGIRQAYHDLAVNPEYTAFRSALDAGGTRRYAVWDDHDYGLNDGGADFEFRLESKAAFLDFFEMETTASGGADQPGIYQYHRFSLNGLNVGLILLDTRSFRSPLRKQDGACPPTDTVANTDPKATVLGELQWQWLETVLRQPADVRLIASSIQVLPEQHCFEKWANFPGERQRLLNLIRSTGSAGVVLLSGDRHLAEISELESEEVAYPLYELTTSGLNSAIGMRALLDPETNRLRLGDNVTEDNFGSIEFDSNEAGDSMLSLQIHSRSGEVLRSVSVSLKSLTP